jgi:hypothetical protein
MNKLFIVFSVLVSLCAHANDLISKPGFASEVLTYSIDKTVMPAQLRVNHCKVPPEIRIRDILSRRVDLNKVMYDCQPFFGYITVVLPNDFASKRKEVVQLLHQQKFGNSKPWNDKYIDYWSISTNLWPTDHWWFHLRMQQNLFELLSKHDDSVGHNFIYFNKKLEKVLTTAFDSDGDPYYFFNLNILFEKLDYFLKTSAADIVKDNPWECAPNHVEYCGK